MTIAAVTLTPFACDDIGPPAAASIPARSEAGAKAGCCAATGEGRRYLSCG
jgi:hypothetical protein